MAMENSISARMLVFEDNRMLLVQLVLVDPRDGYTFWVAPGG